MQDDQELPKTLITESTPKPKKSARQKKARKRRSSKKSRPANASIKRVARPYPASSFQEALPLAEAIHEIAAGERVRRLTLLAKLDKSPTSSATRMLITNSTRYGLTKGGYELNGLN